MLHSIDLNDPRVVGFEASGKVSDADYKERVIPALDKVIEAHGCFRFLMVLGEGFEGYAARAMLDDAMLIGKVHGKVERVAIVTDNALFSGGASFAAHFTPLPVRQFALSERDAAEAWITE